MKNNRSNAGTGRNAVEKLVGLIEQGEAELLEAIGHVCSKKYGHDYLVQDFSKLRVLFGQPTSKIDLFIEFGDQDTSIAVAVVSAKEGGGNQIERRAVDFYLKDQGLSTRLIYLLKLLTGSTKPSAKNSSDYAADADLAKGYAYYRDLSPKNQADLIAMLRSVRERMIDRALLGRGEEIRCSDKRLRPDRVNMIAFFDANKGPEGQWTFCDPGEVIESILSTDVRPVERGARQIQLGYGITLKRYGGGLFKGDTSIKDYLQLQIQPRKVLDESTNWAKFQTAARAVSFGSEVEADNKQSRAAKRGLAAETALIEKINHREEACSWIVEECCGTSGYGNFAARKPSNKEKPDVVLYETGRPNENVRGISLKTYKPEVSFSQANRGTVETYARDLGIPTGVIETLRDFTTIDQSGRRIMLNNATEAAQQDLLRFFVQYQRQIISHVLRGKAESVLKADWMMFHENNDDNWVQRIGDRSFWLLFPMASVIDCCCKTPPSINKNGNLILGIGLTLQRKGGDGGATSANDLQFKINPRAIIQALGN